MDIILAATWHPRGELPRLRHLLSTLRTLYRQIVISLPPDTSEKLVETLRNIGAVSPVVTRDWAQGRFLALEQAVQLGGGTGTWYQYADFDRLLRWVEVRPEEWRHTIGMLADADHTILGRTPSAYQTHPQALVETEAISNRVVSVLLGRQEVIDVSAGSQAFSRRAAEYLIANARHDPALGTDGEWPILLQRAGFSMQYLQVEGLDWESADRYREQAAGTDDQRSAASSYDADPANWHRRTQVALQIVRAALDASQRLIEDVHES